MTIKLSTSRVMQALLGALHLLNLAEPMVSPKWKPLVTGLLLIGNWAVSEAAHVSNPDGTSAKGAWTPPGAAVIVILAMVFAGGVFGQGAQSIPLGGSAVCTVSGTQTTGYVLTATDGSAGCSWQSPGATTVDGTTLKNAWYIADGGSANAITGTTTTAFPVAYAAGQAVLVKMAATNTGATTININSLGVKSVTKNGVAALAAGNLVTGSIYVLAYDGTRFQVADVTLVAADITSPLGFTPLNAASNLSDVGSASTARTNLGLGTAATKSTGTSGTTLCLLDATACAFTNSPTVPTPTGSDNSTNVASTAFVKTALASYLLAANNLSDVASASTSRTNLGFGNLTNNSVLKGQGTHFPLASGCSIGSTDDFLCPGSVGSGSGNGAAGRLGLSNGSAPGTTPANTWGWVAPSTITTSWWGQAPNASPSANQVMLFGSPSSNVSAWTWTSISGTGSFCMTTSCAMTTPNLGTPSAGVLTNATGLPVATGISGLGTGVATALAAGVSGSGAICLATGSDCGGGGGAVADPGANGVMARTALNVTAPAFATNAKTATYQVLASDFDQCKTIPVASGTFTITLVASGSQPTTGECIEILNYGTGILTLARSGQNINGAAANLTGVAGSATAPTGWHVTSDGTNYIAYTLGATTSAGGLVMLEAHTASTSASLDFSTCLANTSYDVFQVEVVDLVPGTTATNLWLRFSTDGGSTFDTSSIYSWASWRASAAGATQAGGTATTRIDLAAGAGGLSITNWGYVVTFKIYNPRSTTRVKRIRSDGNAFDGTSSSANPDVVNMVGGTYNSLTAVNAFQLSPSSGTFTDGTAYCLGVPKS